MKFISIVKQDRWLLIICLALSIVYLVPFALGGAYSVDDWLRSDTGNSGWEGNGRPAASIIMAVMSLLPNGLSFLVITFCRTPIHSRCSLAEWLWSWLVIC